jgi:hypothetical protein
VVSAKGGVSSELQEREYKMRSNKSPIVVLAIAVALLVVACGEPAPPEDSPQETRATVQPEAATEVAPADPTELPPKPAADDEDTSAERDVPLSYEEVAAKLRAASPDGVSDPVVVFSDDFSAPGWVEFDRDEFTAGYVDGTYELAVMPGGFSAAFGLNSSIGPLTDFYFQVETQAFGPADNGYGIRFREQEAGFYEFTISSGGTGSVGEPISSGGTFSIDKFAGGSMERIVPFKSETPMIVQGDGELNVLGVLAVGPDISIYINGQEVASFSDPDHSTGGVSLRVNPYFEEGSRTLFDNVTVWVPAD